MSARGRPILVVVYGLPATGKTWLARRVSEACSLPVVCRDAFKELLFDHLGWNDRAWSKRVGQASYELLYHTVDLMLGVGQSAIAETNFDPASARERLLDLKRRHRAETAEVLCTAPGDVLLARFRERIESGERHPGHVDHLNLGELERMFTEVGPGPLALGGEFIEVDMTDLDAVDDAPVIDVVRRALDRVSRFPPPGAGEG